MNFRPFQISRVSAICRSSSAVNLISKFTPIYRSHVKILNKDKQNSTNYARIITNKCRYRTIHSPFNIYQQSAFIHDIADTEQAVKQRVRNEQGCDCQIPEEPELAFRQTTKIQCFPCSVCKPCIAPPLGRPKKLYDDSTCQYEHKCNPDLCNINPARMDNICCVQVVRKKLPPVPTGSSDCQCVDPKVLTAPPLCMPQKLYDPEKFERVHEICEESKCVRLDDVCGYKVEPKELPVIPVNNCQPCQTAHPLTAPILKRPVLRYDPACIPYPHSSCSCESNPPRRDSFFCEPTCLNLPPMPCSDCIPCQQHVPTLCPLLKRLEARYDESDMKYKHECPASPCDTPTLRRDNNIISVTLTKKKLPRICEDYTCVPCMQYRPLTAPELGRPICYNANMAEEQLRMVCIEEKCVRRDGDIQIWRRCLPPVPTSVCCKPCSLCIPCKAPNLETPKKLYDDTTCKYNHVCVDTDPCENPLRMDDIKCYKVTPRKLPKPPCSPDCKPCILHPKTAPQLCRPCKCYDDSKHKYRHPECPEDPCEVTPRADDFTGIRDEVRILQSYKPLKCKPCQQDVPCKAPVLRRPRARYDDSCMLYDHKNCPPSPCGMVFRRDHYLCEGPKKLPKVKCGTICQECQVYYPTTAPCLGRPQKLYEYPDDPVRIKECPRECPPRRDDLLCWKPKRKKLPSFRDCDQCCCYSTAGWTNKKHTDFPLNSKRGLKKEILPTIKTELKYCCSTKHVSNLTKLPENEKLSKLKHCNEKQQQIDQSSKSKRLQSKSRYHVVKEPTWKCMDNSNVETVNKKKKKYDYSEEKWLREGAEQKVEATEKNNSHKKEENTINRFKLHSKCSVASECITPVKFNGFNISKCNDYLFIKKDNKLQSLRIASAFSSDKYFQETDDNTSATSVPKNVNSISNKNKTTTELASITKQKRIKQDITSSTITATNNFILKLKNKMQSTLFQKISNFFKHRENVAKLTNAPKKKPEVIFEKNNLKKQLIANVCEKYEIESNPSKLKNNKNKPYIVQKFKNHKFQININNAAMCCSTKLVSQKEGKKSKAKLLPKKMKNKGDQIRNFSTSSKTGPLYYKHIDISDDYIGKIYKVKLKKIGVRNLMLEKNDPDKMDEEPHTICYICKVVPRYQPIIDEDPSDMENVKINYYKEKRRTLE